jgi:hypothetical protein
MGFQKIPDYSAIKPIGTPSDDQIVPGFVVYYLNSHQIDTKQLVQH